MVVEVFALASFQSELREAVNLGAHGVSPLRPNFPQKPTMNQINIRPSLIPLGIGVFCSICPIIFIAIISLIYNNIARSIYFDLINAAGMGIAIMLSFKIFLLNTFKTEEFKSTFFNSSMAMLIGLSASIINFIVFFSSTCSIQKGGIKDISDMLAIRSYYNVAALTLPIIVLYPILEEVIFRGLVLRAFRKLFNNAVLPVVLTSLLFAIMHLTWKLELFPILSAFIVSIVMSIMTIQTSSLLPAMIIHSTYNFAELLLRFKSMH